ncbi:MULTISPECIES: LPS-assembly protein LptD [Pacificibacter]|uniref:LPS-assembly protein LptD n=1 Tax=Pacificibacter TaxID=1042323 RepID=UPI001C099B62|nr:LPS assembly protein LptD [Pacificibacter sp. 1_MG-2023]MBU2936931.1 LPS assembly protein LptD [Pacificibacter marinus]MDO6614925.1 LPS assembly protein LptD [Pacificibacter sp. 1_MG-2023]
MTVTFVNCRKTTQMLRHAVTNGLSVLALTGSCFVAMTTPALAQNVTSTRPVAQDTATQNAALLADAVNFTGTELIASGNVEVHYGDIRLSAERLTYDRTTGALLIDGPIYLSQNGGDTVVLASAAELSSDLRNGILTSARLVIDQQFQLAAASMERIDGRYTRLARTVSSTCKICEGSSVPLWQIRASEVIHDSEARQIYFTDAQLRLWDVPVFFLPRLRLPDPTLERATGFLVPVFSDSSTLGTGLEMPYFITLGDQRDLTISPFIATEARSLDLRYRQAYSNGTLEINGALSTDETDNGLRGYMFVDGQWDVGNDLQFGIDLRATSDISYLLDYDIYDGDRLTSRIWLERYGADTAFDAQLIHIRTLRESEVDIEDTLPFLIGDTSYKHYFSPETLGGTAWVELSSSAFYRESDTDIDGMDVLRTSAELGWKDSAIWGPGIRVDGQVSAVVDAYSIWQSSEYNPHVGRITPAALLRLSYPLERFTSTGAYQMIEPIVQLSWSQSYGDDVPNSDSILTEFDSGNLLALSQFSGSDRRGLGARGAIGAKFSHQGPALSYGVTAGRIIADESDPDYTAVSGLSGITSDLLVAAYAQLDSNLYLSSRALLDSDLFVNKWETRLDLLRERYTLGLVHSYVQADADENRDTDLSELSLDSSIQLNGNWTASLDYRYDFDQTQAASAGLDLEYSNECARIKLGISRRYTDTDSLDPTINYSISVGFGAYGNQTTSSQGTCGF